MDSHLMAAAFYKHIRTSSGETHISASPTKSLQTSKQVSAYLLCSDCEHKINKGGEEWVLRNYARRTSFPLLDKLSKATPSKQIRSEVYFKCDDIPEVDLDKINYFVASIIWRAATYAWKSSLNDPIVVSLGPYKEKFRQYLNGESGFPTDTVMSVLVSNKTAPPPTVLFPSTLIRGGFPYYRHGFYIPGLLCTVITGKMIPKDVAEECTVKTRMLRVSDLGDKIAKKAWGRLAFYKDST